ncbi:MAG TPA: type II secretion system protein [Desulfotignum sp.]|nr:type II secretion system protein [Desulfotignum sp.]
MAHPIMNGERGFTYPAALMLVVVISVALTGAHQQWQTSVKRDREMELLFRGTQILEAINAYCRAGSEGECQYPRRLEDLLKDPRVPGVRRHLRKLYKDPMTRDGHWGIVYDGRGNIKGVFSKSAGSPLKIGGFPDALKSFENKAHYHEWKFVHNPRKETTS